jgi:hypothetical protein
MIIDSTIDAVRYPDLACGEIFALELGGGLQIAMKVESRSHASDQPNSEILRLDSDRPPELMSSRGMFSSGVNRRSIVARMKKLTFVVRPEIADILFDLSDARGRVAGCVFLVESDVFLVADVRNVGVSYVNMRTGEGFDTIEGRNAIVIPCWQLVETVNGQEVPLIQYRVPTQT